MQTFSLSQTETSGYSKVQLLALVVLRVVIGWHFMYEGLSKIMNPGWSSAAYLLDSDGWFSGMFHSMASNQGLMNVVDFLNIWGLTAIGFGLIIGLFSRYAKIFGIVILAFYYLSHPSFVGAEYAMPSEGNYLFINKTLIEMVSLWVLLMFPTSGIIGIDSLIFRKKH